MPGQYSERQRTQILPLDAIRYNQLVHHASALQPTE